MVHTHTLVFFFFRAGWNLLHLLVFWQGSHFRMNDLLYPSLSPTSAMNQMARGGLIKRISSSMMRRTRISSISLVVLQYKRILQTNKKLYFRSFLSYMVAPPFLIPMFPSLA